MEVIAHRGASAHRAEHTAEAFDLAVAQGADVVELDLRATACGEPVCLHDPTLARTHGDPRAIAATRLDELDAATRPLTLAQVLWRYGQRTRLLLELKAPGAPVVATVERVRAAGVADRVVLQSFDADALRRARRLAPELPAALLTARRPTGADLDRAAAEGLQGVGVPQETVDADLVAAVHRRGLVLRAYTANTPRRLRELADLGVDGLITDAPDRARAVVDARRRAAA
ncbi:glycerophosphodiester phosphodiesterase [Conexibacter sp. SYSU D00693]|uniref:glycerophosphodiester phosphodiesterase n=1 Tax=Conexibacter sp. SYSU D00693 TaxID=2812560 RepID=UPI00196AE934|nr:glycerophosphodiester phosphodiesterase [Conexibacter sp. SYSU D00693]